MIRKLGLAFLAAWCLPVLAADEPAGAGDEAAILAALKARSDAVIADYNAGDLQALVGNYTADAWHISPRRPPAVGREALARYFGPAMPFYTMRSASRVLDAEISGDTATVISENTLTGEPRPGALRDGKPAPPFAERRLNLTVFRRQADGRWLIHRFVDTTPAEAPPPAGATPLK